MVVDRSATAVVNDTNRTHTFFIDVVMLALRGTSVLPLLAEVKDAMVWSRVSRGEVYLSCVLVATDDGKANCKRRNS